MPDLPLKPFAELPVAGPVSDTDSLVTVTSEGKTARLPIPTLLYGVYRSSAVPGSPAASGDASRLATSTSGLYSFAAGTVAGSGWGKTPRYAAHWDDLTPTTRFLRVDDMMTLSKNELENAWKTLDIGLATSSRPGLVKASDSLLVASDGTATVPAATPAQSGTVRLTDTTGVAASQTYVDTGLSRFKEFKLEPATRTKLGGILSSDSIVVDGTGLAQVPRSDRTTYGLVRTAPKAWPIADADKASAVTAETAELIARGVADTKINPPDPVTGTPGVILPQEPLYLADLESGLTGIRMATGNSQGVVYTVGDLTGTIGPGDFFVPSARAVKTYVDAQASSTAPIGPERLPYATPTARGAVKTSSTIRSYQTTELQGAIYVPVGTTDQLGVVNVDYGKTGVTSSRVPSVEYMLAAIAGGGSEIQHATDTVYGTVVFRLATGEVAANAKAASAAYVDEKVSSISATWAGGTVTQKSSFLGGLTTPVVAAPAAQDVIPYSQVKAMVDAGGGGGGGSKATTSTLGTVKLGTATVVSGGLPVGFNASDQMYVGISQATSATAGTVKLGTDTVLTVGDSAPVGALSSGSLAVAKASATNYGTVKTSGQTVASPDMYVGTGSDGRLALQRASNTTYGVIKTGYASPVSSGALVGLRSDGAAMVPPAGTADYGTVKVAGGTLTGTPAIIGYDPFNGTLATPAAGYMTNGCACGIWSGTTVNYTTGAAAYIAGAAEGYSQYNPIIIPGVHMVGMQSGHTFGTVQVSTANASPTTRIPTSADTNGRLYIQKSPQDFAAGDSLALATHVKILTYSEYMALVGNWDLSTVYVVKKNGDGTGASGVYVGGLTIAT